MNLLAKLRTVSARWKSDPVGAVLFALVTDSAVYLAGGMLLGLGNLVLVPLYTRTMGPREFGIYALLDISVLLMVTVCALKMDVSYLKWFADSDPDVHPALFGSMLWTGLAASAAGGGLLFALVATRVETHWLPQSAPHFAWMLLPIVVLESLQALLLADRRARRMPVHFSASAVIRLFVMVAASIYFLSARHLGLYGLFLGRLVGDTVAFLFLTAVCARSFSFTFAPSLIRPMVRFGAPLIWSVLAVMLQDASGRYFLSRYGSLEQVGYLGATVKIASVFQILIANPFGIAWGGVLFQIAKEREACIIFSAILNYICLIALAIALILSLFGATLFHLFTPPSFYPAIGILPVVLLIRSMSVIEQPASTGIYLSGSTGLLAVSYSVGLGANLLLLRFLVPAYGLWGTVLAWLCGSMLVPILFLWFGQRRYRLNFRFAVLAPAVLLWVAFLAMSAYWRIDASSHPTAYAAALSMLVCLILGCTAAHDVRHMRKQRRLPAVTIPALEVSSQ